MKTIHGEENQAVQYVKRLFEEQRIKTTTIDHGNNRSSLVADLSRKKKEKCWL